MNWNFPFQQPLNLQPLIPRVPLANMPAFWDPALPARVPQRAQPPPPGPAQSMDSITDFHAGEPPVDDDQFGPDFAMLDHHVEKARAYIAYFESALQLAGIRTRPEVFNHIRQIVYELRQDIRQAQNERAAWPLDSSLAGAEEIASRYRRLIEGWRPDYVVGFDEEPDSDDPGSESIDEDD